MRKLENPRCSTWKAGGMPAYASATPITTCMSTNATMRADTLPSSIDSVLRRTIQNR